MIFYPPVLPIIPEPSDEQMQAVCALKGNVVINSVAGSGKTTTIMYLAMAYPQLRFLAFVYNKRLRKETTDTFANFSIANVEVHTYHSYAYKYYSNAAYDDKHLKSLVDNKTKSKNQGSYDVVIMDECQDMKPVLYDFVNYVIRKMDIRIVILGDIHQNIYAFTGATTKYIIDAAKYFANKHPWSQVHLRQSYRVTKQMANFLNYAVIGCEEESSIEQLRLTAMREGTKPRYCICKPDAVYDILQEYLKLYNYDDIFILAASVSKSPQLKSLANRLTTENIPICMPSGDDRIMRDEVMIGKVVFSTFHSAKGLERKVVIVCGFDESYYKCFKTHSRSECSNELYVALTRAKEHLIIVHYSGESYFKFLKTSLLPKYADCEGTDFGETKFRESALSFSVTDLCKFIRLETLVYCLDLLDVSTENDPQEHISVPLTITSDLGTEEVSDINGTFVPIYYKFRLTGKLDLIDDTKYKHLLHLSCKKRTKDLFEKYLAELNNGKIATMHDLLRKATIYCGVTNDLYYKIEQISDYSWFDQDSLNACMEVMRFYVSPKSQFEVLVKKTILCVEIVGYIDCIDHGNKVIWEFKCVRELSDDHVLQLAIYTYLAKLLHPNLADYQAKLLNIYTGEVRLVASEILEELVTCLIKSKLA